MNSCQKMLNGGRYTWCHDNILHALAKIISENKKDHITFYVDVPKFQINGGTIPSHIFPTELRPDLVAIDTSTSPSTVFVYELTCPFEGTNMDNAHDYKEEKYADLVRDIEDRGFSCVLVCFEIGSRGVMTRRVQLALCSLLLKITKLKTPSKFMKYLSKLSLLSSYSIFHARKSPQWTDPPVLSL